MNVLKMIYVLGEYSDDILVIITATAELVGLIFILFGTAKGILKRWKQALIGWCALIAVTLFVLLPSYINHKYVRVPDVTNMMFMDARHKLVANNLKYSGEAENEEYVKAQNPEKGELVAPDTVVELIFPKEEDSNTVLPQPEDIVSTEKEVERIKHVWPGDFISFGRYEMDGNRENGEEDIPWIVLERMNGKILVVSRYGLDAQPYHNKYESVTWETSSIREWLNSTFYNTAFSDQEREQIVETALTADANPYSDSDQGFDTKDNVFLFSLTELNEYIVRNGSIDSMDLLCRPTSYAVEQGVYKNAETYSCWWWLRTSANKNFSACSVNSDGTIDYYKGKVNADKGAVRPAMWIELG